MPSSLLQEYNIQVPVSLAATLGLEQAVLLQVIADCLRHRETRWRDGYRWLCLDSEALAALLPFWSLEQIDQVAGRLQGQGLIRLASGELALGNNLVVALNEQVNLERERAVAQPAATAGDWLAPAGAVTVDQWQLGEPLVHKLQQLHGISRPFIQQQAAEFQLYWRDRGEREVSWDGRFETWVVQNWRNRQEPGGAARGFEPTVSVNKPLAANWTPGEDAVQILVRTGVTPEFIEEAIPEFVLYWRERGDALKTWNSKFIAHIRRQWARYSSTVANEAEPRLLPPDWTPSEDFFEILDMANIDREFARQQLPEFMLFWRESKQMLASWNSKFLQHVKHRWAQQHHIGDGKDGGQGRSISGSDSTRARSITEDLTDTNW